MDNRIVLVAGIGLFCFAVAVSSFFGLDLEGTKKFQVAEVISCTETRQYAGIRNSIWQLRRKRGRELVADLILSSGPEIYRRPGVMYGACADLAPGDIVRVQYLASGRSQDAGMRYVQHVERGDGTAVRLSQNPVLAHSFGIALLLIAAYFGYCAIRMQLDREKSLEEANAAAHRRRMPVLRRW